MIRIDGVRHTLDAIDPNVTLFFERQLESIEATLYKFMLRELKYRQYIPVSNRDNPGAETITYRMYDKVGMSKIIASYADDLPRVDVFAKEYTQKVKGIGESFGYNTQELRAAAFANTPLETLKADAARRAHREKESKVAWVGDEDAGLIGFLNNTNVPTLQAALNAGATSREWDDKTANEIIKDFRLGTSQIKQTSKGVHQADTALMPIGQYDLIAETPRSDNSDLTILEFIQKPGNSFGLKNVDWMPTELDAAFTGSTDGMILYELDPMVLEQRIPLEMVNLPVQEKGLEFIINCEGRLGGVVIRYPLACLFYYGI